MILSYYLRIPVRHRECIWEQNNPDSIIDSVFLAQPNFKRYREKKEEF